MTQISGIHTPCKKCSFAKYEQKTQTGCYLEYLDIYKNNNEEVIEAYDDEKEFFVINNKKCIGYREDTWFEKRGIEINNINDKIEKYKTSNYAHYIATIDLKKIDLTKLKTICESLMSCDIKPQKIVVIRYQDTNKSFPYKSIEDIFKTTNVSCLWRIQTILDNDMPYEYILYDIIKNNKQCRFVLNTIDELSINKVVNYVNDLVYTQLKNFCVGGTKNKTSVMYSSTVYRHAFDTGKDLLGDPDLYQII